MPPALLPLALSVFAATSVVADDVLPEDWDPLPAPGPTIWGQAGSGAWTTCQSLARDASVRLPVKDVKRNDRSSSQSASKTRARWLARAERCPHAPPVVVLAAYYELTHPRSMPPYSAPDEAFDQLAEDLRTSYERVRLLLEAARDESQRRGQPPPPMMHYLLAHVAVSSGDLTTARVELAQAWRAGAVDLSELELVAAVLEFLAGDTERALDQAHRVYRGAQGKLQRAAGFLLALIYERAGAHDVSHRLLRALRTQRLGAGESEIEVLLPLHERLYLTALEHRASDNAADAIRFLEVYLARAEPEDPERKAAERQLAELRSGRGL